MQWAGPPWRPCRHRATKPSPCCCNSWRGAPVCSCHAAVHSHPAGQPQPGCACSTSSTPATAQQTQAHRNISHWCQRQRQRQHKCQQNGGQYCQQQQQRASDCDASARGCAGSGQPLLRDPAAWLGLQQPAPAHGGGGGAAGSRATGMAWRVSFPLYLRGSHSSFCSFISSCEGCHADLVHRSVAGACIRAQPSHALLAKSMCKHTPLLSCMPCCFSCCRPCCRCCSSCCS